MKDTPTQYDPIHDQRLETWRLIMQLSETSRDLCDIIADAGHAEQTSTLSDNASQISTLITNQPLDEKISALATLSQARQHLVKIEGSLDTLHHQKILPQGSYTRLYPLICKSLTEIDKLVKIFESLPDESCSS